MTCKVRCSVPGPVGCLLQRLVLQPSRIGYLLLKKKLEKSIDLGLFISGLGPGH